MSFRTLLSVSVLSQARGKAVPLSNQPFLSCSYRNGCCIHSWLFPHKYITIWSPHFQHLTSPPAETRHRAWFKRSVFHNSWERTKKRAGETFLPFHKGISYTVVPLCIANRHHFYVILTKDWRESAEMSCSVLQPSTNNPRGAWAAQHGRRTPGSCKNIPTSPEHQKVWWKLV